MVLSRDLELARHCLHKVIASTKVSSLRLKIKELFAFLFWVWQRGSLCLDMSYILKETESAITHYKSVSFPNYPGLLVIRFTKDKDFPEEEETEEIYFFLKFYT